METTRLGKTGLKVSRICLGTMTYGSPNWRDWVLGEEESRPFIKKALEAGIGEDAAHALGVQLRRGFVGSFARRMLERAHDIGFAFDAHACSVRQISRL